jgi:hypothetical protein
MQTLTNIVFGAVLAGLSLGPAAWSDAAQINAKISKTVMVMVGLEESASPLDHAVARARAALPHLPNGSH